MGLEQFQEIIAYDSVFLVLGGTEQIHEVRREFFRQVIRQNMEFVYPAESYRGKEYFLFFDPLGRFGEALFAFRMEVVGPRNLLVDLRVFNFAVGCEEEAAKDFPLINRIKACGNQWRRRGAKVLSWKTTSGDAGERGMKKASFQECKLFLQSLMTDLEKMLL